MIIRAISLDFLRAAGYAHPADPELHRLAVQFAKDNLAEMPDFSNYNKVWVAAEVDQNERPVAVHGALGFTMRPDLTLARMLNPKAFAVLFKRAESFFSDNGGRGSEVLLRLNLEDSPETLCPHAADSLKAAKATPAHRWAIVVR